MRQFFGEVGVYFGVGAVFLLFNLLWAKMCWDLFVLHVQKVYRVDLVGTELDDHGRTRRILWGTGIFGLLMIAVFNLTVIAFSVSNNLHSPGLGVLFATGLAVIYVIIPRVLVSRLRLFVEGVDNSAWEDAFMAPPRTSSVVLFLRLSKREIYLSLVLVSFMQAFAIRLPAVISAPGGGPNAPFDNVWRAAGVVGSAVLVYFVLQTIQRVYLYLIPEAFIAYRALDAAGQAGGERDDDSVAKTQAYRIFTPKEWRGERHAEIFSLARAIMRAPRRYRRRFTRAQVETIDSAARVLCATLLAGSVNTPAQAEVIGRCVPYATALVYHRDPVFIAEEILRTFEADHGEVGFGGRGLIGAIGAFNEVVRTTGPLLRLLALAALLVVLVSLGRTPEVLDFVKKLLGG